jgi:hypothetical protein
LFHSEQITLQQRTPAAEGREGDTAGMIAYNGTYLYVCVANYDGSTEIWKSSQWTAGAW